jgi:pSer/pThr/pTyr-binding forkhead associated (FHA) protein
LVGRSAAVDICIDDQCVSRYHCEIGSINGILWVRDLGSANGVTVNGMRARQAHLMPGDHLEIGETGFRVEYDQHSSKCYEDVLP